MLAAALEILCSTCVVSLCIVVIPTRKSVAFVIRVCVSVT